jgi:hypothetical protein
VRCSLEGVLVAMPALVVAHRDEMGRSWARFLLPSTKNTLAREWWCRQWRATDPQGSQTMRPRSEMRPNRSSTRDLGTGHGTWAFSSGDQLCPASAAGRNGATSPTGTRRA